MPTTLTVVMIVVSMQAAEMKNIFKKKDNNAGQQLPAVSASHYSLDRMTWRATWWNKDCSWV